MAAGLTCRRAASSCAVRRALSSARTAANTRAGMRGIPPSTSICAKSSMKRLSGRSVTGPMLYGFNIFHKFMKPLYAVVMPAAIEISGLVKTFGPTRALDGLDLIVEAGEVHGFLGP